MGSLLNLPREIRDLIYLLILVSERPPPSLWAVRHEREFSRREAEGRPGDLNRGIYYPLQPFIPATHGLVLACRQTHAEVRDTIALLKDTTPLRYKVDCMLDHEFCIYPTWLSIPYLSPCVDTVDVDIRHFGAFFTEKPGHRFFTGSLKIMRYQLLWGLNRFLVHGPNFLGPKTSSKLQVRTININIVSTPERDDLEIPESSVTPQNEFYLCDSGWLEDLPSFKKLGSGIRLRVSNMLHRAVSEANLLIECVNHMTLSVDGELVEGWDFQTKSS